jgi:hypothetical protein
MGELMYKVSFTPRPLYPRSTPDIHWIGGWVCAGAVWTLWRRENLALPEIEPRPSSLQSFYRLGFHYKQVFYINAIFVITGSYNVSTRE